MRRNKLLTEKVYESVAAVLPITVIVLALSISIAPLTPGTWTLFFFGALMLIFGMGFFTLGVEMSMIPMGEGIGVTMSRAKHQPIPLLICFMLGMVVTIAEPDLQVLAEQVPSIPNMVLILTVAVGVGIFLMLAQIRVRMRIPLSYMLVLFYILIFILAFIIPDNFVAVSFDSGGVTTGPITVPFIMALGIGMASVRSDKNSSTDSFGLTALCSIGPVLSVMILGICYKPQNAAYTPASLTELATTRAVAGEFARAFPFYAEEVAVAIIPILVLFCLFQLLSRRFHRLQLIRIGLGLVYTYVGLVVFLTGVNVGFMPAGQYIGQSITSGGQKYMLIPIGMLIGYFIVKAEPAVRVLTKQVEEITNGSITQQSIGVALSIGIALSVGLAMLRILTGLNILVFLIPGYALSLIMTFFVPQIFTGIAFDSGGVASGPMTTTFLLPLAMGACEAVGGNILTDAFGIVAMVAMTPLCTIQLLGLYSKIKKKLVKRMELSLEELEDSIVYFDET
ncbi:MAG: DUF1538 domain-containing protein [Lachnospiraceae bacterium]|nr:DUF1538 domain-containing protein [Lachnospiraceae bacterium]